MRFVLRDGLHDLCQDHFRRSIIVKDERLFDFNVDRPTRASEVKSSLPDRFAKPLITTGTTLGLNIRIR